MKDFNLERIESPRSIEEIHKAAREVDGVFSRLKFCRICLENYHLDEQLISPCVCSGTHQHVHPKCIKSWL